MMGSDFLACVVAFPTPSAFRPGTSANLLAFARVKFMSTSLPVCLCVGLGLSEQTNGGVLIQRADKLFNFAAGLCIQRPPKQWLCEVYTTGLAALARDPSGTL
eukprot:360633-Chlamydomonas_euryale.AAC.5